MMKKMFFKTDLFEAVENRNLKKVKSVLKKRPDVIHKTKNGDSPLHVATSMGFTDIMEILLQYGCNINKKNTSTGVTPLHIACRNAHFDSVIILQEHDADPAIQCALGNTPLHESARLGSPKILKLLFNFEFDINVVNEDGWTALHRAVYSNREDAVQLLCQQGIDISIRNNAEKTAHDCALQLMYFDLAEIIRNFEKIPDHPKTVIPPLITPVSSVTMPTEEVKEQGDASSLKIENLIDLGKESLKSLFTWKPPQQQSEEDTPTNTTSISTGSSTALNVADEEIQSSTPISFFERITLLTSQIKYPKLTEKEMEPREAKVEKEDEEETTDSNEDATETSRTVPTSTTAVETTQNTTSNNENSNNDTGTQQSGEENELGDEMHECPVCFEIPLPPTQIYQCMNGHLYCGTCKERPNMFNCPQCNVDIATTSTRNRYAEQNIARLYKDKKK